MLGCRACTRRLNPTARVKEVVDLAPRKLAKPKRTTFAVDCSAPVLVQAASVVLSMLALVRHHTLAELEQAVTDGDRATFDALAAVVLPEQIEMLLADPDVRSVMDQLRAKVNRNDSREQILTLAQCPQCRVWSLCSSGGPSRCLLSGGCAGIPVRASVAKRIEMDREPEPGQRTTTHDDTELVADDPTEQESGPDRATVGAAHGDKPAEVQEEENLSLFEPIGTETEELDPFN